MGNWRCVNHCGACCHLDPADRPNLKDYLSNQELELYLSMVGTGGWCVHFDSDRRECRIYEQRPRFCRVQPDIFKQMYSVSEGEFNDFAIDCCRQQIECVYGRNSQEMLRYNLKIETA